MDAELMFECLIYLNIYYFAVFATCEIVVTVTKYCTLIKTPYIGQDAGVVVGVLVAELSKLLLFKKFKKTRRGLITAVCVLLTGVSIAGLVYTFLVQCPILKLEIILNVIQAMLTTTEIAFGVLQIFPCCKKVQYY